MPTASSAKSMPSRPVIATLLILLSATLGAQEYHYNLKFSITPRHFADTIAIEVDDGRIYLPVVLGGTPTRFLLDTGASMGALFTATPPAPATASVSPAPASSSPVGCAAALPQPVGFITSHDATGQTRKTPVVRLPNLQIGRLTLSGYHANLLPPLPGRDCAGIIGFDIFNKGILAKIDVRNRRLILTDRRRHFSPERQQGYEARYRLRRHVPLVSLSPFSGYTDEARFDTGDRSLYTLSSQSLDSALAGSADEIEAQVEARTHGSQRISHFGTETTDEVAALRLTALRWGDFTFRRVATLTAQGSSAVGTALLDYGAVVIDPRRRRLMFLPYDTADAEQNVDNRLPDIYYVPDRPGRPTVGLVWEHGEAYRQGFRQGDLIMAVNGIPVNSIAEFTNYPFIGNQVYTVTVSDKLGTVRQLRLHFPTSAWDGAEPSPLR